MIFRGELDPSWEKSMGLLACTLSHRNVWKIFLKSDKRVALVFEDDNVVPDKHTAHENRIIIHNLCQRYDWSLINLSPCMSQFCQEKGLFPSAGWCANAYLITKQGANALLDMTREPISVAVDWFGTESGIECTQCTGFFELQPRIFEQEDNNTTIGSPETPACKTPACKSESKYYGFVVITLLISVFVMVCVFSRCVVMKKHK
jgi:GR25 family glycosyltransferase involved in LPS biosynthesis